MLHDERDKELRGSGDGEVAVELYAEGPAGVGEDTADGSETVLGELVLVGGVAGLKIHQGVLPHAGKGKIRFKILAEVYDLHLVGASDHYRRGVGLGTAYALLRRDRHPVERRRQLDGTVGLNGHTLGGGTLQEPNEAVVDVQGRLATGEHDPSGGVEVDGTHYVVVAHLDTFLMGRVAEGTAKVAPRKAYEYRRIAGMMSLALEGVEYFVDLTHKLLFDLRVGNPQRLSGWE